MGKPSIPSIELERSMNLQVHVMTLEEALRHADVIDEIDDKRREKLHNIIRWTKDMHKTFTRQLKELCESTEEAERLFQKHSAFEEQFKKAIDKVLQQEIELEKIDDNTRIYMIQYTADTREKLRDENSRLEKEIIARRVKNDTVSGM